MRGSVPLSSEPPYQEQLESEIESLRQQVNNQAVDIVLLRRQVSALEKQARSQEIESLRLQLASLKAELKAIGEAINDPRTDLTMTMSEVIVEQKQQLAAAQSVFRSITTAKQVCHQCNGRGYMEI